MSSHFLVITNKAHPLHEKFKDVFEYCYDLDQIENIKGHQQFRYILDLTLMDRKSKSDHLKNLILQFHYPIISDLSGLWTDYFIHNIPQLAGAVSLAYFSPKNAFEFWSRPKDNSEETKTAIIQLETILHMSSVEEKHLELTFHYPRLISQIINEAYFALDEHLCTPTDLDLAMKNGVNYPLGPIEWSKKIGLSLILQTLDELYSVTLDDRYRANSKLRLEASQFKKGNL